MCSSSFIAGLFFSDSEEDNTRSYQNRPKLKAARVIPRKKKETDGHASDSSSSTFSASELPGPGPLVGSTRNINSDAVGGGVVLNANKLQS